MRYVKIITLIVAILGVNLTTAQEIQSVEFKGAKKNSASFLKKLVVSQPQTAYDTVVVNQDLKKLKRLTGVSFAKATFDNGTLVYTIEENHTLIPAVNVWSVDDIFSYRVGLYDYNLFGRNITFGGFYQFNGENSYGVNLFAPYLFSNRLGLAVNFQKWSSQEPFYYTEEATNYIYNNTSIEALLTYEFNFKNNFRLGYNIGRDTYAYNSGFTDASVNEDVAIDKSIVKFLYEYNNLDFTYQYVTGIKNTLTAQQHFTNSDLQPSFFVWWNDFNYYKKIGTKGNWASRVRAGLSTNSSSVFAPFALDNNVNVRGVGNLIDRGTGSFVVNTEYRHTLIDKGWFAMQGNYFVDAGTWRHPGGDLSDFVDFGRGQLYTGLGFRLIHKKIFNAVFRLDYGYSFGNNSGGIVFGIGQYF